MSSPRLRLAGALAVGLAAAAVALPGCGKAPPADPADDKPAIVLDAAEVAGEGATFPEPILKHWTAEFRTRTRDRVKVNYTGKGSGAGITSVAKGLVGFGVSDAPMNRKQLDEAKARPEDFVHVPLVIGAVVPVYNLPGVDEPLRFTGPVLARMFTGDIKAWDHKDLVDLNPVLAEKGRDKPIVLATRSEPSGTSFIFSDYLSKVSPDFRQKVGASTLPKWPVGIGYKTSGELTGAVAGTPGAVGYVELTFALDSPGKVKYGSVRNRDGADVPADLDGITAAAEATLGKRQEQEPYSLHDLTYNLTDAGGKGSYPIAGMSFAVVPRKLGGEQAGGAKGRAIVGFLKWATGPEGQDLARKRNYAPLPEALRKKIAEKLDAVEVGG